MTVTLTKTDTTTTIPEVGIGVVRPDELTKALTAVIPHASTDDTLPVLTNVRFRSEDGRLVLSATDRYSVGTYSITWDEGGEVDALLSVTDAKELLRYAKAIKGNLSKSAIISLTFRESEVEVFDFTRRQTMRLIDHLTPVNLAPIFTAAREAAIDNPAGVPTIGLNPSILAKFAKAGEKNVPLFLTFTTPAKPVLVTVGDHFVGLIMPVRIR